MWQVATTETFDEWFAGLAASAQVEIIAKVELLKLMGPQLGRPHVDTLKGSRHANMKEVRATVARQVLRVAFAFDPNRTAILLVAGDKRGANQRRFYQQLIDAADALCDRHLARLSSEKKEKGRG
jgi:hypothetical protein